MLLLLSRTLCDLEDIFAAPYLTSAAASAAHLNGTIIFKELMQLSATRLNAHESGTAGTQRPLVPGL